MNEGKLALITGIAVVVSGCSMIPTNWGKEEGLAWCDERYLDMSYANDVDKSYLAKKLRLSKQGYIYSTAAVLALQQQTTDAEYNFIKPATLEALTDLDEEKASGFGAYTYRTKPSTTGTQTTIIAFAGSNQLRDYTLHNAWLFPIQYSPARNYVKKVANDPRTKGTKLVVTGYSLGGGLAAHVTKHPETSKYISEAWAFNPSPRIGWGVSSEEDRRIYMLATSYEVLGIFKRSKIGAPSDQRDESFNLIRSSSIHSHYRWILGRQILQYADLAEFYASGGTAESTEPLQILKTFSKKCRNEDLERIGVWRERYLKKM